MTGTARTLALAIVIAGATAGHAEGVGDAANGEALYRQCASCHQVGEDARNKVGPHLNGVVNRAAASVDGFRYSSAIEAAGAEGLTWDADTLDTFLEDPRKTVPGTRMSFRGVRDAGDRADLIAYLQTFSDAAEADQAASDSGIAPEILALEGDPDYGAYLSGECTTCHRADGGDTGIPSIVRWPEDSFVIAMHAYKSKTREHPVMNMVAGRLGDEEIAALAAYFATLEN